MSKLKNMLKRNEREVRFFLLLFLALAAIFFILQVSGKDRANAIKAGSWEEVKEYQYEKTPGLERAEKLGLAVFPDYSVPIPDTDQSLRIEEAWYNQEYVYFFYSIDIDTPWVGLPKEEDIPSLTFVSSVKIADPQEHQVYTRNWQQREGVIYKGRFYGRLTTHSFFTEDWDNKLQRVDEIELNRVHVQFKDHSIPLEPISLAVQYDASRERVETIAIHDTYNVLERELVLDRMDLGTTKGRLYLQYESSADSGPERLVGADVKLTTNFGETRMLHFLSESLPDGTYVIDFEPLNRWPEKMELSVEALRFIDNDEQIQFSIDGAQYHEKLSGGKTSFREKMNQKLGSIYNSEVSLDGLYYDERGIHFDILYTEKQKLKKPYIRLYPNTPNTPLKGQPEDLVLPLLVKGVNENGEPAEFGGRGSGPGELFSMSINREYIEKSERIEISVTNLIAEIVTDWNVSFDIPPAQE